MAADISGRTRRERDVPRLIADGMTNGDIAARMAGAIGGSLSCHPQVGTMGAGIVLRKRNWLVAALGAAILVMAAGGAVALTREPQSDRGILATPMPETSRELSLLEAWHLAEATASGWDGPWSITALFSTDVDDAPTPDAGASGRRRTWQADLVNDAGATRWLRMADGVAVDAIDPGYSAMAVDGGPSRPPAIDSPDLLALALRERPALRPGADKAHGYHFAYGPDPATGRWLASVSGEAIGVPARVLIDPDAKAVVRAERLAMRGGGLLVSRDAGESWAESPLPGVVTAIAADSAALEETPPVFAASWSGDSLGLWATSDAGQSWARVAVLPGRAGPSARAMAAGPWDGADSVLLATNDGVWVYRIPDGSLRVIETGGPVLDLLLNADEMLHAILMKPADPESARHYRWDSAGSRWELVDPRRVTRFADTPGAVAFEEVGAGQTILASGASGQYTLRVTPRGIERAGGAGADWELTQLGGVLGLAVAPDFDASGVALAALYTGAVVLTTDHGQTWRQVTEVPGRGAPVTFVGRTLAFISVPGSAQWEGF